MRVEPEPRSSSSSRPGSFESALGAFRLTARDPLGGGVDFSRIDALADELWGATQPRYGAVLSESAAIAA